MKTPDFWYKDVVDAGPLSTVLLPFGALFAGVTAFRISRAKPVRLNIPVICIGNLTAGGSGKTPVVAELCDMARHEGLSPHILTRGYGGNIKGPERANPDQHSYRDTGDEPLLLSHHAPVWISRNRAEGGLKAEHSGADMIVMDDGFQNPSLHKDLSIIVIDGYYGFGNGRAIPAGPLRETISNGLNRADAIILLGEDRHDVEATYGKDIPIIHAETESHCTASLFGKNVVAFAGIGHPEKFRRALEWLSPNIVSWHPFPDHYAYKKRDIEKLLAEAQECDALLVTTEKDAVRLPPELRAKVEVAGIKLKWKNPDQLHNLLDPIFRKAREHHSR